MKYKFVLSNLKIITICIRGILTIQYFIRILFKLLFLRIINLYNNEDFFFFI